MMGQMSLSISPTTPHLEISLYPHFPGADLHPYGRTPRTLRGPTPPSPGPCRSGREMGGKRAAGRQVLQGKHSAGCNARDLEITLSYKGKKVQAR